MNTRQEANYEREMGMINTKIHGHDDDLVRLTASNEKRKQENVDAALKQNSIQHTVEETNTIAAGVARSMEEFKEIMTESMGDMKTSMNNLSGRVAVLEGKQFDWSKFMSGLVTTRGMTLVIAFLAVFTIMFLAVVAPESLPDFIDLIGNGTIKE